MTWLPLVTKTELRNSERVTAHSIVEVRATLSDSINASSVALTAAMHDLKAENIALSSQINALERRLSSLDSSVLKGQLDALELWKADIMSRLIGVAPSGRPQKTHLYTKLQNSFRR